MRKTKVKGKENLKSQKAITLIALVITIIVLLILAGVSIATLTGENGILTQANNAKTKTTEAKVNEEIKLAYNAVQTDSLINGWDINKKAEELKRELQKEDPSATVTVDGTNLNVSYKNYDTTISEDGTIGELAKSKIIINEFKISGTKVTNPPVPTEFVHVGGTIEEGYVISDNASDENKGADSTELLGNQFVWVPVEKDQKITINVTSEENITSIVLTDPHLDDIVTENNVGKTYSNVQITPTFNGPYKIKVMTENGEVKEQKIEVFSLYAESYNYEAMVKKMLELLTDEYAQANGYENILDMIKQEYGVETIEELEQKLIQYLKENDGFSLGETENYTNRVNSNGGFYIGRYEAGDLSATENRTSTTEGTLVIQKDKYVYNWISETDALTKARAYNTSLTSSLMTSAAWNRILLWFYETGAKSEEEIKIDSTSWGNYKNDSFSNTPDLIKTGEYEQTKVNNIYDLAGNVQELTSYHFQDDVYMYVGGCFSDDGSNARASNGWGSNSMNLRLCGFRVALYL